MVALEIKKSAVIKAILEDPGSDLRVVARHALAKDRVTLRSVLKDVGFVDGLDAAQTDELRWVLKVMGETPGVEAQILATLRVAFDHGLVVIFDWTRREASCDARSTIAGSKVFLTIGTPALDMADLKPGMFAGAMA